MTETAKKQKTEDLAVRMVEAANRVRYGSVSINLKIHDGRIVDVIQSVTESTRERVEVDA